LTFAGISILPLVTVDYGAVLGHDADGRLYDLPLVSNVILMFYQ
jgi:hypothetical protein